MCLLRRSLITWSPEFTSGDLILNLVTAGSGVLEIGARQLNNWRLYEPPDLLPFCQSGVLSTRLYNNLMPRHYFRLPGRYIYIDAILSCPCNFFLLVLAYSHYFLPIEIFIFYFGMCCDCGKLLPPIMRIINYCNCALYLYNIFDAIFNIFF